MRDRVPCGACRALVPLTGCRHWRPQVAARRDPRNVASQVAQQRARAQAVEAVASFRRMMRLGSS